MSIKNYYFTSESVSHGHPDKICDQISDRILDHLISIDKNYRVAVESMVTPNDVIIGGEIRGPEVDKEILNNIARQVIKDIGYEQNNFHWNKVKIHNFIVKQSADIAAATDNGEELGAGDQGIMFGYATNETKDLMPAPIFYAHKILQNIFADLKKKGIDYIGPDAKSQVTIKYENGKPVKAASIVVSIQHKAGMTREDVKKIIYPSIVASFPNESWMCKDEWLFVNPSGQFVSGGPEADSGLTGRKIIADTYGGAAPHGGGAFSGKDPTKVDRSATYMCRYLAKNIVSAGLAEKCLIQVSYAIGVAQPLSLYVNLFNTGKCSEDEIIKKIWENVDLTPGGIISHLDLCRPIYAPTASYGHFGREYRNGFFPWEALNLGL
jgi:S-adenosylmethionine synthetase